MTNKLRILCLHGFTSNGTVHAHQVRRITARLSETHEFLFPDGPHAVNLSESEDPTTLVWRDYVSKHSAQGHRAWWFARGSTPDQRVGGEFVGLDASLKFIGELIERTGPVHAIWGFSQGAGFAGMLVALLSSPSLSKHPLRQHLPPNIPRVGAGIFFSGFKARFSQYDGIYEPGIEVPTLHVMGEQDQSVTVERSEVLLKCCEGRTSKVLKHKGGHDIPKSGEDQDVIVEFVTENVRVRENGLL